MDLIPQVSDWTDQSVLLPRPGMPGHYYAFLNTSDSMIVGHHLIAALIDADANGGQGEVLGGLINLGPALGRALTVVPGSTEDTLWVWASKADDSTLVAFPVTQGGIGVPHTALTGLQIGSGEWLNGSMKAARTNDRLAVLSWQGTVVHLAKVAADGSHAYDPIALDQPGAQAFDLEFSPNGRFLYTCGNLWDGGRIWQYDLSTWQSDSVFASRIAVEASDTLMRTRALQLGPDGRLYTWTGNTDSTALSVITDPDQPGLACGHELYSVPLAPGLTLDSAGHFRPNLWWPRDWPTGLVATERPLAAGLAVFPRPAVQSATVSLPTDARRDADLTVTAWDMSGRRAPMRTERTGDGLLLHRGSLPAGVYGVLIQGARRAHRATVVWADGPEE